MEIARALIVIPKEDAAPSWPSTPRGGRQLFPIANRPILEHHLRALRAAGLIEAKIVAADDTGAAIREAVGDGRDIGLNIGYLAVDSTPRLGDALAAANGFVADEPVLVQTAGALLKSIQRHIRAFAHEELDAMALRLPRTHDSAADATAGLMLSPRAVRILAGGTREADPLVDVEAMGGRVRVQPVDGCCPCQGDIEALLESNRRVLTELADESRLAMLNGDCTIQGPVQIDPSARLTRAVVRGPAVIGPGACITDSYVGPYTSIGAGVEMEGTEIEHSIVLANAQLRFVGTRLESSVIGVDARVVREFAMPAAMRICLGAGAEVVLR